MYLTSDEYNVNEDIERLNEVSALKNFAMSIKKIKEILISYEETERTFK